VADAHSGAGPVWEEVLRQSGLADRGEMRGGAVSRTCRNSGDDRFRFLVGWRLPGRVSLRAAAG